MTGPQRVTAAWRAVRATRPAWLTDAVLRRLRRVALATWAVLLVLRCAVWGVPLDRTGLLVWIATGLAAVSIGRRSVIAVVVDFLPLAAVLAAYDHLRGLSDHLGMPTWWHPQVDADRFLFGGYEPTVWLQEHLKSSHVQWYDVVVSVCYFSFFLLPYLTAGVMWLRSRAEFYRWSLRFVALSFGGFALFALVPAAPPWAAALCTGREVAAHPGAPACMFAVPHRQAHNVLGAYTSHLPGAAAFVQRLSGRGLSVLHLDVADQLWTSGARGSDLTAAFPSLHLAGTMLFCLFAWRRVRWYWRPLLVAYPLVMAFSLVYSGEHYVTDCLAGALAAIAVDRVAVLVERRLRSARRRPVPVEPRLVEPVAHGALAGRGDAESRAARWLG